MNIEFAVDISEQHLILNPDWCVDVTLSLSTPTPDGDILFFRACKSETQRGV